MSLGLDCLNVPLVQFGADSVVQLFRSCIFGEGNSSLGKSQIDKIKLGKC